MEIKGMVCEFCAKRAESGLKGINWVRSARVDLEASVAHIMVKKGKSIDLKELNQSIKDSGFALESVEITATGELTQYEKHSALRVKGSEQVFLLVSATGYSKEEFLDKERLSDIEEAAEGGEKEITVIGHIHYQPQGSPPALSVESFEIR